MDRTTEYLRDLSVRFSKYRSSRFPGGDENFVQKKENEGESPEFVKDRAAENILFKPGATLDEISGVIREIPSERRHPQFSKMTSSQALTQSVFGNLKFYGKLGLLADFRGDDGRPLFFDTHTPYACKLEFDINYLGEHPSRRTNVDVLFDGQCRVAVECKFSEREIGPCSRPRLDNNDEKHCNGKYEFQGSRTDVRCYLTKARVKYWDYIPILFDWSAGEDHDPCPLWKVYQLVRNILAACVKDGEVRDGRGHAILLYDARNPAFKENGEGIKAYKAVKDGLKTEYKGLLQQCTWQDITIYIRGDSELSWLGEALNEKYGL